MVMGVCWWWRGGVAGVKGGGNGVGDVGEREVVVVTEVGIMLVMVSFTVAILQRR